MYRVFPQIIAGDDYNFFAQKGSDLFEGGNYFKYFCIRGGGGGGFSRKAINRGTAIIQGKRVFLLHPDCKNSKNKNYINAGCCFPASRGLSFFLSFLPCCERPLLHSIAYSREGTGYFLKITKINPQQEKPMCPNCKK